ncbi:MAG: hypothetical protein ACJAVK_001827 [Akkermansiaceae bacterium]|jgi:hypothetical protein
MSNQEWRVLDGEGNEQGPYSFGDLQSYYTSGNITHETMIWTEGLAEWVPAGQVEGLLPDMPQVVALAPAVAPIAQPAAAGGIHLSPQIPGATGAPQGQKNKNGAPTWISAVTILSGVVALVLFFFPWVSLSQDISLTVEKDIVKLFTQTGMQSITQNESMADEMIAAASTKSDLSEDEPKKKIAEKEKEAEEEEEEEDSKPAYEKSTLNLIALIGIALGLILALIGFLNQGKPLVLVSQVLFVSAAILISTQMAMQFPIIAKYIERQEEVNKNAEEFSKTQEELAKTSTKITEAGAQAAAEVGDKETTAELSNEAAKTKTEMKNVLVQTKQKLTNRYQTTFEPSCFVTIGLLGCSLLLLVVTMASGDASTIIIPQPGAPLQQGGQPQQPRQAGSGLKFH